MHDIHPMPPLTSESAVPEWVRSADARFRGRLVAYAARIVGQTVAQDVVQETFLRLCSQDPARTEPMLAEWLFTVCRRQALDVSRKEKRMTLMTETQSDAIPMPGSSPAELVERADSTSHAMHLLGTLPTNQQECLRLKFQGGLKYAEIANVTGLSESNVGFLIHTGLATIRAKMNVTPDA